ncbi:DMT family transporter [Azotobacter chroococcum]|uniref:DMT family transporter n=1 Tax=Azotobacter chroococcum TaxID=353 RepID=A0AA43Z4T5_9GAMM|nr:DMT family transporter [Azotobacter chroococcum]NHN76452.1 DMT family transporter [Azotobacter chroococcum]
MKRLLANPYLLLTLASLFWSGNLVMGRGLRGDLPPVGLAFWRWTTAFILVLPLALPYLRSQWPALRAGWWAVLLLGVLGVGCYNTFSYIALQYTTATSAILLNSFIPVATIALAFLLFGKRLSRREALGVAVSLIGVLILVAQGSLDTLLALSLNVGDLWMLAAVVSWGLYTVGLQWRPQGVHPMLLLAACIAVGLLAQMPAYAWEIAAGRSIVVNAQSIGGILYAGVVAAFLGFLCYNAGVAAIGPARGSLFIHLMPVFGTILSALLLGERPHLYHLGGIALVFAGIALTMRRPAAARGATLPAGESRP